MLSLWLKIRVSNVNFKIFKIRLIFRLYIFKILLFTLILFSKQKVIFLSSNLPTGHPRYVMLVHLFDMIRWVNQQKKWLTSPSSARAKKTFLFLLFFIILPFRYQDKCANCNTRNVVQFIYLVKWYDLLPINYNWLFLSLSMGVVFLGRSQAAMRTTLSSWSINRDRDCLWLILSRKSEEYYESCKRPCCAWERYTLRCFWRFN